MEVCKWYWVIKGGSGPLGGCGSDFDNKGANLNIDLQIKLQTILQKWDAKVIDYLSERRTKNAQRHH
jgi:hypothetical protein